MASPGPDGAVGKETNLDPAAASSPRLLASGDRPQ